MRRSLRRTFFRPERPTLTSRSLQSITRPFQKRFCEVFGNARILIFYLSLKAWEEKSLPKSHLGWFFLVFGGGKATKENMSIFWFIWPLIPHRWGNTRTLKCAISKVPKSARGSWWQVHYETLTSSIQKERFLEDLKVCFAYNERQFV